ncbi:RNA polymerase sigma factor [Acidicapsa dinghuensis]|uniref:RNA polymerase sigma factor n=1 Tax=Acidicapsa dinghuensis TaxID=2218256 RepID=A0ABW1EN58_9BACT|nr:RNA polymerase sigma factor [Acidicapsa dinghuensis]
MFQHHQNKIANDITSHLLEKARSGDRSALGELIGQHHNQVQRMAYRILQNAADAEDVTQEVSLKVLRKLHTFESQSAFSTWLTRIAINESLLFLRKSKRMALVHVEQTLDSDTLPRPELPTSAPNPEQQYLAKDELNRLYRGIARLPSKLRKILLNQVFLGLSLVEVAELQGLSVPAAKTRSHRARKMLSQNLNLRQRAMRTTV